MISILAVLALVAAEPKAEAQPAAPSPVAGPDYKQADWAYLPAPQDMLKVYPKAALKARTSGRSVVSCTVMVTGRLKDCLVVEESSEGFGQAALDFTSTLRMKAATRAGVAVEDTIRIPLVWTPPPF